MEVCRVACMLTHLMYSLLFFFLQSHFTYTFFQVGVKEDLLDDAKTFLENSQWYINLGMN